MSRLALFLLGPPRIEREGLVDKLLYLFLHNRRDQTSELSLVSSLRALNYLPDLLLYH